MNNQGPEAMATMEHQNPFARASEALQGFAGHISTRIQSGIEAVGEIPQSMRTLKMLGAAAVASVAFSHTEAALANPDSVAAENVPGLTAAATLLGAPEVVERPNTYKVAIGPAIAVSNGIEYLSNTAATASTAESNTENQSEASESEINDLIATCTDEELVKPDVAQAEIRSPGTNNQTTNTTLNIGEVSDENCRPVVKRLFQYEVIVKELLRIHGKLRHKTVRLARWPDSLFNKNEAGMISQSNVANPHNKWQKVQCSVGAATTKAVLKMRGVISDSATGQETGRKIWYEKDNILRKKQC